MNIQKFSPRYISIFLFYACVVTPLTSCASRPQQSSHNAVIAPTIIKGDSSSQVKIASKQPLVFISSGDPIVASALDAGDPYSLLSRVGKNAVSKGKLLRMTYGKNGSSLTLKFGYEKMSTRLFVRSSMFSQIPDMRSYLGKTLLFSGQVTNYQGRPELTLESPSDLKAVQ